MPPAESAQATTAAAVDLEFTLSCHDAGMRRYPRPCTARSVPLPLEWLLCLSARQAWILILFCVDLAALGDVATGADIWFGPVYLFVMCLATWCLGWRVGQLTGVGCMALTFAINGAALYPYGPADMGWNVTTRFAAVSTVIAIVAGARRAYIREWWLARTDPLTGALNRQAFFELGAGLAKASGWRLLIYADLDGLKQINDRQGHAAGDSSLEVYAAAVRKAIRWDDMFARVGGDEFLIFMPVKDQAAARVVASRLHDRMNSVVGDSGAALRCSVGGLIVPPGEMHIDRLVRLADNLMYQAKQRGACLQVEVAPADMDADTSGRARRAVRAPLGPSVGRKPPTDRRIAGDGSPATQPVPSEPVASAGKAGPPHPSLA